MRPALPGVARGPVIGALFHRPQALRPGKGNWQKTTPWPRLSRTACSAHRRGSAHAMHGLQLKSMAAGPQAHVRSQRHYNARHRRGRLPGHSLLQGGSAAGAELSVPSLAAPRGVRCAEPVHTTAGHSRRIKHRTQFVLSLEIQSIGRVT